MRFKEGSKVEVFSKRDMPSGAWRCGEIVFSGNGHAYSVRYDCPPGEPNRDLVEKVPGKAIRPCPPPVDDFLNSWTDGDVVEVFNDLCWKTAAILKVFSPSYYLVRLIGSSKELRLHKINIRVRQSWQDGKWVVIGKNSGSQGDMKCNKLSTLSFYLKMKGKAKTKFQAGDKCTVTAKTNKRPFPFQLSDVEAGKGKAIKMGAMEKKGPVLEACIHCFQRSKGDAGCHHHLLGTINGANMHIQFLMFVRLMSSC